MFHSEHMLQLFCRYSNNLVHLGLVIVDSTIVAVSPVLLELECYSQFEAQLMSAVR